MTIADAWRVQTKNFAGYGGRHGCCRNSENLPKTQTFFAIGDVMRVEYRHAKKAIAVQGAVPTTGDVRKPVPHRQQASTKRPDNNPTLRV